MSTLAFCGIFLTLLHALFGTLFIPAYFILQKPEAPISVFFRYCVHHFGGVWFIAFYSLSLFAYFSWSINHGFAFTKRTNA